MLKQLKDKYWSWKRRRAEQTINDAYRRTAPKGQPLSADLAINNYYAKLREKPPNMTPGQMAALQVQQETIARKDDPPSPEVGIEGNVGHFADPTVKINFMLPPMKGKDE